MKSYKPFAEVARGTLEVLLAEFRFSAAASALDRTLAGLGELPIHADVAPAFQMLCDNRVPIVALTNGGADTTHKLLQRARLDGLVERVISIDEVRRWKPSREVYLHAAKVMGVAPEELALVAAHAWDVHGASQAGLATGWVSRLEKRFLPLMNPPDATGDTLHEVIERLLDLPLTTSHDRIAPRFNPKHEDTPESRRVRCRRNAVRPRTDARAIARSRAVRRCAGNLVRATPAQCIRAGRSRHFKRKAHNRTNQKNEHEV